MRNLSGVGVGPRRLSLLLEPSCDEFLREQSREIEVPRERSRDEAPRNRKVPPRKVSRIGEAFPSSEMEHHF